MYIKLRNLKVLSLSIVFIFLFQMFFNIRDIDILYVISKAVFSVIAVCVLFLYLTRLTSSKKVPIYTMYILLMFFTLLILATLSSHIVFGQPLLDGLLSQLKLFAIFYYFLGLYLFYLIKPDLKDLIRTFVFLGVLCLIVYSLINILINPAHVWKPDGLLVVKDAKGYRYRLPDVFIIIYLFYCLRTYLAGKNRVRMMIMCLLTIVYLILFQKQRAEFVSIMAIFLLNLFTHSKGFTKFLYAAIFALIIVFFITTPNISDLLTVDTSSLETRQVTATVTYNYVSSGILPALFGAGNLNPLWNNGFARLYGENFFLSDIGWMGVLFEFGLIGSIFCLITYFIVIKDLHLTENMNNKILIKALKDYIYVRLILSVLSPHIPYFIGIYMTILAISVYLRKRQMNFQRLGLKTTV